MSNRPSQIATSKIKEFSLNTGQFLKHLPSFVVHLNQRGVVSGAILSRFEWDNFGGIDLDCQRSIHEVNEIGLGSKLLCPLESEMGKLCVKFPFAFGAAGHRPKQDS